MTKEEFLSAFAELAKSYQAAPEVLRQISNISLCIIVGPSGAGKTALINRAGLDFVPSDTSRPARLGELDNIDMFFRTDYDQILSEIKNGQFVQIAVGSGGDFYATRASSYPSSGVAILPVIADVIPQFRKMGFKQTITAFSSPPTFEEWTRRMKSHDTGQGQHVKRLKEAVRSFEFALHDSQTHFIYNDVLDEAVAQLQNLVYGKIDYVLEDKGKTAAQAILDKLKQQPG